MSRSEEAWKWTEQKGWYPFDRDTNCQELNNVRASLRRLMQMRLPISAIEEIESLLSAHEEYVIMEGEAYNGTYKKQ